MLKKLLLISFFGILGASVFATPSETLENANKALASSDYDQAISLYYSLMEEGYESTTLYYNMGLAYFRKKDMGRAVLYLERARRLSPRDEDIMHNLKLIRNQHLKNRLDIIPQSFLERSWSNLLYLASTNTWTILSLIISWGAAIGFYFWLRGKVRKKRKIGFIIGLSCLAVGIFLAILAYNRYRLSYKVKQGVTTAVQSDFKPGPEDINENEDLLYPGLKVDIKDEYEDWYQIRLSDGRLGWIKKKSVTLI